MYRQHVSQTTAPSPLPTSQNQNITPSRSDGSLSAVVQRIQQDAKGVSEEERKQLESAIGTRSTGEILAGKQTSWIPEFQGISTQLWGDSGQVGEPIQAKENEAKTENHTGLPNELKAGIENLSGMAMDDVKVHYNSPKPAQIQALAYTKGTDIHVAPGQEQHLPHEAWHVVQQMQGRVEPTFQMKGLQINGQQKLEKEADIMGVKALQMVSSPVSTLKSISNVSGIERPPGIIQGIFIQDWKLFNQRWMQGIMDTWGGASARVLELEIIATVGQENWDQFQQMLISQETYELDSHPNAAKIIQILTRSIRDLERDSQRTDSVSLPQVSNSSSHADFSFSTHNIEKYGESTANRQRKAQQETQLWDRFQPDVGSMQEVTRPDLFERDVQTNSEFTNQFLLLPGPQYQSGTYQENYPAVFNRASVHFRPTLHYIHPQNQRVSSYTKPLSFGKQAARKLRNPQLKQARPTSFWELYLPASSRRLRPAFKYGDSLSQAEEYAKQHKNLRHRMSQPYFRIRYVNVHTSPGKSTPTINHQINGITEQMNQLQESEPNTMSSGDFYMQKGAKKHWNTLKKGTENFTLLEPGVATNFKYGTGIQTADHFVIPSNWQSSSSFALPPVSNSAQTNENLQQRGQNVNNLSTWEEYDVDHAFVFGNSLVPVQDTVTGLSLYLQNIFREIIYQQNNCLIYAIANSAEVNVNQGLIQIIRNQLQNQQGVAIGEFITANEANIAIIMRNLNLYGIVYIHNVDNPEMAADPVAVEEYDDGQNMEININYSQSHFFAAPRE